MKIHKVVDIKPGSQQQASQQIRAFLEVLRGIIGGPNTVVKAYSGYVYALQESDAVNADGLRNKEFSSSGYELPNGTYAGFSQYSYNRGGDKSISTLYNRSNTPKEGNMTLYYTKIKSGVLFCVTGDNATSYFNYEHMSQALIRNADGHLVHFCSMPVKYPTKSDTLSQLCIMDITSGIRKCEPSDFDHYLITEGKAAEDIFRASLVPFYVPDIGIIDGAYLPITLPKKQDKSFVFTLGDKEYISMAGFSGTQLPVFECEED